MTLAFFTGPKNSRSLRAGLATGAVFVEVLLLFTLRPILRRVSGSSYPASFDYSAYNPQYYNGMRTGYYGNALTTGASTYAVGLAVKWPSVSGCLNVQLRLSGRSAVCRRIIRPLGVHAEM